MLQGESCRQDFKRYKNSILLKFPMASVEVEQLMLEKIAIRNARYEILTTCIEAQLFAGPSKMLQDSQNSLYYEKYLHFAEKWIDQYKKLSACRTIEDLAYQHDLLPIQVNPFVLFLTTFLCFWS